MVKMFLNKPLLLAAWIALATAQQEGYLGFNSGATIDDGKAKQQSDFESEFKTAQGLQGSPGSFNSVRLYTNVQSGTTDTPISAFPAALATNTSMLLGIWCSGTTSIENELKALQSAISQYGQKFADLVVGISVGSEDVYRISESGVENNAGVGAGPDVIVDFIKEVRQSIANTPLSKKPIGHVDSWSAWANSSNSALIEAVDFVGTDVYPYYEKDKGNDFSNATTIFDYIYNQTISAAGNKPVWVTESGWPTEGPMFGQAEASVDKAKKYWDEIGCSLFGRTNVWWYTLRDSNPANKEKFAITKDLSTTPSFNLTCPADSGAPASINTTPKSGASMVGKASSVTYLSAGAILALVSFLV
jgi:glucan endo-1,3-beta-D-glucosidase